MSRGLTKSQYDSIISRLKRDGKLTPSGILAMAKKEDSPLHKLFEWDDAKASQEYRLIQARQLIKVANAKIEKPEDKLVHVPAIKGEGEYKTAYQVVNNVSDFEMALTEALSRLRSAERSVSILHETAQKEAPDKAGVLAIAMKGLETAASALDKLH